MRISSACFAAAMIAAGCAGGDIRDQHSSTITVLYPVDERSWAFFLPSQFLLFVPLTIRGNNGKMHGWLARSWEYSADWRTCTVHLRSGVRWHDGHAVTAHDAKFTLELLANPGVGGEAPNAYSVRVIDDTTFAVTFRRKTAEYWLYYYPLYPRHLLENLDPAKFYDWDFWTQPVGDGPFRYVRRQPKTMMEFSANAEYFEGKPRISRLVLKFGEPLITELLSGNVDAVPWIKESDILKLRGDDRFRIYSAVKPDHIRAVIWNHRNALFADPAVRRALTLAIDRRALLGTLNLPANVPTFDVLFTHEQFYRGEFPAGLAHDSRRAMALLDSAGWRDSDGDGIRDRNGRPFRFRALVPPDQSFANAAVFIQAQLRAIGVAMDIVTLEERTILPRVEKGDFEATLGPVNNDLAGHAAHIYYFGRQSRIGYHNSRVAALLDSAFAAFDPREVDRLYSELMPIFQAEQPVTFLYPLVRTTVAHRRVHGLSSPYRDDPLWFAGELWLEDGRRR